jgi:hypothetical protein
MSPEISRCPKCRGFNGGRDLSTNKFTCSDCGYNGTNIKIDWDQYVDEYKTEMEKENDE